MNAEIEEIRRQIHDLRNFLGPVELFLTNLEAEIKDNRTNLERRIAQLELRFDGLLKQVESRNGQSSGSSACATRRAPGAAAPGATP